MTVPNPVRRAQLLWNRLNDSLLNVSTVDSGQWEQFHWSLGAQDRSVNSDGNAYGTPDYYYVRRIVSMLRPGPGDIVYDIGSGRGRILCVACRMKVRKCVGIEISPDLAEASRINAAKVRGKRAPIEIRCEDAAAADLSDGTIYFLFNPFGPRTLEAVLNNIESSLASNPRRIQIAYYNSLHHEVLESRAWARPARAFQTFRGLRVQFYENCVSPV